MSLNLAFTKILGMLKLLQEPKLIRDFRKVARKVDPHGLEFDEYDVIIVGGGTSGCVLASRLTEDPSIRVLLIEAGGSGKALVESRTPSGYGRLLRSGVDYNLYTEPQVHAGNKKKFWPRARLLGGCSSINAQMAQYGSPSDFNEWSQITGDDSWSWENFSRYFRKFEKYTPDPRFPHVDPSLRGTDGPVQVGYFAHIWKGSELFIQSSIQAGIPFSPDFTTTAGTKGTNKVMSYFCSVASTRLTQSMDDKRLRVSMESAYLTDKVLERPNLKVVTHARVTKILFERVEGQLRAVGVEFAKSRFDNGPRFHCRARKEVIVSGGAVHTPQILMLSGVGPADHLKDIHVPLVCDHPNIGNNLLDHPVFNFRLQEKAGISLNFLGLHNPLSISRFLAHFVQYQITGKGPLSTNIGEAVAFFRTDDPVLFPPNEYPKNIEDSNSGPDSPDIELVFTPVASVNHNEVFEPHLHAFSVLVALLRPTSVGTLRLKSSNPWEDPLIDPNYLETEHDVNALMRGIRAGLKICHTAPLASIVDTDSKNPKFDHHLMNVSDDELRELVRERVETIYHPVGSCRMAPYDRGGVVDSQLRVYGINNLRVCDASIFPKLVSGHTAGACIAAAEKLADVIKYEYSGAQQTVV
ncbi:hypothetical protein SERLADRAFT_449204 [Serpula lacrymans var. lacrymans S7.9]|uniref:Glucose-methanol-choline oxidoreductase N-terminal domain-containing protein n=1 Tax=Serpula lacrymans var. lacrymans (strain S7.9) TaxID=578457 RepID=F8NWU6_SERL9|nr:uncharacterized protein SERLADRAFT_449204 [Serpula lacrymans var. lacrymans S7.9]EGO24432.1 hypothetical protein SERLADRAFT_449204 [Serpula lacrymans var. lacrymans S7.9]